MLKKVLLACLLCLGILNAQTFTVKLNPFPVANNKLSAQTDTVRILAIMVQFEADRDAATFGNGKFGTIYTGDYGNTILDPLPHDKPYFEAHLEFVKNYFSKVSKNNLVVEYTVLPDTFSVSQTMRNYSPPPNSDDFTPLADFARESWEIADNIYPGFDFSAYDLFTIFHAGVGRDISLPGSLGNERDLPSVYLSSKAFKEVYGANYEGIPVSGGNFRISNSMIIPETESRELSGFGGTVLVQITINGLLAASVASHLGLPDLFDTETGLSAIGRFGLMDGQSIFAYNGVFPPEPSAWEKIFLGWAEPVVLNNYTGDINITADLAAAFGDTVIVKIPISSTEYFLVENRRRDVFNNGAVLRYVLGGDTLTKVFAQDRQGFYSFSVDSVVGVVIDVDEFDWAIPGLINDTSNYSGGIVIWHIDENVINSKIADNKINTDKNRRGVDVEEADGIQDIGERFQTIFGDFVIGEGTYQDIWFAGNDAELYTGIFSKDTRPSSRSNEGGNSLVTLDNFSESANKMRFSMRVGDSLIVPLIRGEISVAGGDVKMSSSDKGDIYTVAGTNLYRITSAGTLVSLANGFSSFKPAVISTPSYDIVAGAMDSLLNIVIIDNGNLTFRSVNTGEKITSAPVASVTPTEMRYIHIGTEGGRIVNYNVTDISQNPVEETIISTGAGSVKQIVKGLNNYTAYIKETGGANILGDQNGLIRNFNDEVLKQIGITVNRSGEQVIIVLTGQNNFYIHEGGELERIVPAGSGDISGFSIGDLNRRGENYIIYARGNIINAINIAGATAENFPFTDERGAMFSIVPLTADLDGGAEAEIIAMSNDGRIFAINGSTGKVLNNYPITTGASPASVPVIYYHNKKSSIAVVDVTGRLYAWSVSGADGVIYWGEEYGNSMNSGFTVAASNVNAISEYFPKDKFYNYPNPVYGGDTFIRYYISEDSKVNVKIFDIAGDFVAELDHTGAGGVDNEIRWNVNSIQSGIYLARIEATSISGKSETGIIKIAVVK